MHCTNVLPCVAYLKVQLRIYHINQGRIDIWFKACIFSWDKRKGKKSQPNRPSKPQNPILQSFEVSLNKKSALWTCYSSYYIFRLFVGMQFVTENNIQDWFVHTTQFVSLNLQQPWSPIPFLALRLKTKCVNKTLQSLHSKK